MQIEDEATRVNQQHWEKMVAEGCGYCLPWLELDRAKVEQLLALPAEQLPEPYDCLYPAEIFLNSAGKDVLCLASGGGQQSAVFGLLGANVTVVDLTPGQLMGDLQAAAHYGYPIQTFQADMRDLSELEDESFDVVYQANSIGYVPDPRPVFNEAARVLRPGGGYRVVFGNPATAFMTWDGEHYFVSKPYGETAHHRDTAMDYRHTLEDIFNGLIQSGLQIEEVIEAPHSKRNPANFESGSWNHERSFVGGEFTVLAKKYLNV